MENKNFDILFQSEIESIKTNPLFEKKLPSLLLHVCCAPCSSAVLERLSVFFNITIYYYNPNIHPEEEYNRRLNELKTFLKEVKTYKNLVSSPITLIQEEYIPQEYFNAVKTDSIQERKTEKERGERCIDCYTFRLKKAAEYAQKHKFDYFTTALSISPHKDASAINEIGSSLQSTYNVKFLFSDFKKRNGYKRSLELSKEFNLYRQDYCGCIFSQRN